MNDGSDLPGPTSCSLGYELLREEGNSSSHKTTRCCAARRSTIKVIYIFASSPVVTVKQIHIISFTAVYFHCFWPQTTCFSVHSVSLTSFWTTASQISDHETGCTSAKTSAECFKAIRVSSRSSSVKSPKRSETDESTLAK